jgi:hypothetical protein
MAAPNTAPDDLAVPYDAPRQQSIVAMAQPNAPKKDCRKFWLASLIQMQSGRRAPISQQHLGITNGIYWARGLVSVFSKVGPFN